MREAVYQRARAALARQLTAVDPPLSSREIELQHQELEDAVARLEAEFVPAAPAPVFHETPAKDDFLYSAQTPAMAQRAGPADFGAVPAAAAPYEEDEEEFEEEEERGSRLPLLVGIAAVLLVLIGAGAYVYAERDSLFGKGTETAASATSADQIASAPVSTAVPAAAPEEPPKRSDRLTNGADTPIATPLEAPAVASAPAPAETTTASTDATTSSDGLPLESLSGLGAEQPADTSLVEQRAIYYYQGAEGQPGQANDGSATWVEITKDGRPAIQATIKIPERSVTATVTIYKNYDSALPASHLVEVQFFGSLSDSPIQRVPALVLKQTEQARGQPLAGAAVPVTNELFWIALSNEPEETTRNVQLLREGSWFDIPILFSDQTRALITFEKGIPGDKVFETVMASWAPA